MISDAEHPLMCLVGLLWRNAYLDLLPIFGLGCYIYMCVCVYIYTHTHIYIHTHTHSSIYIAVLSCLFWSLIPCGYIICKHFIPFRKLFFHLVCGSLCFAKAFKFNQVPFVCFCFCFPLLQGTVKKKKILPRFTSKSVLPMFSSRSCIVSSLTFRSLIPFEFNLSITRKILPKKKKQPTWRLNNMLLNNQ